MRILVAGAGAVGCFVGGRLALAGHDVTLAGRPPLVDAVRSHGLLISEPGRSPRQVFLKAVAGLPGDLVCGPPFDLSLITVKSYDTAETANQLLAVAAAVRALMTIQNGVGNEETLAGLFGPDAVISGALDTPVSVSRAGEIQVHRSTHRIGLSEVGRGDRLSTVAQAFSSAGFSVRCFASYRALKWSKLLLNLLANASCAVLNWTPAMLMADPVTSVLEARAWKEALAVLARSHIEPVAIAGYPLPAFAPVARALPPRWLAGLLRGFVAGGRGSKMPSLQIALSAGARSEVDWLNGAVARQGKALGVPTPVNTVLTRLVNELTAGGDKTTYWDRPARLAAEVKEAERN